MHISNTLLVAGAATLAVAEPIKQIHLRQDSGDGTTVTTFIVTPTSTQLPLTTTVTLPLGSASWSDPIPNPSSSACSSKFSSFFWTQTPPFPTDGSPLKSYLDSAFPPVVTSTLGGNGGWSIDGPRITAICSTEMRWRVTPLTPTATAIASLYSSYTSAWTKWVLAAKPEATSLAKECTGAAGQYLAAVATDQAECLVAYSAMHSLYLSHDNSGHSTGTPSGASETQPPATGTSTGGAAESTLSTAGAGPRETGYIAAAMAVAGVAAALL